MIDPTGPLALALSSGSIGQLVAPDSPAFATLDAAARRYVQPLSVAVVGRRGVGRDTMARALSERFGVAAFVAERGSGVLAGADLRVHVLAGAPRRADHEMLGASPRERTVVVLGKADTLAADAVSGAADAVSGAADAVAGLVRAASESLGRPVVAVSQLSACATVSDDEFEFLRQLVADDEVMPSMSGHFLAPARPAQSQMRADLLRRLDAAGVARALSLVAVADPAAGSASTLTGYLRATSGFDALREAFAACMPAVVAHRGAQVRASLELAAAAGADRDSVERLLCTGGV
ncbi:hypothetical protein [Gordonia sputi]|uniref:Uncharacterized protein n=1 Tax=Gordonia sputi NBRC 100414 TaxID=1089453 RepID=H5U2T4_9ACTN|nr:hypothetical protein [Gordonia sputi]NKY95651.1 hypothetical protein [Gordonia sputi]GAB40042.1 hypothetical protein GOSPT_086_00400 [Gordonia sputi NBRC 100414]